MRERCAGLETQRQRLLDELVAASEQLEAARPAAGELPEVRGQLVASLQLLGEQSEKVEELQADVVALRELAQRQALALTAPAAHPH